MARKKLDLKQVNFKFPTPLVDTIDRVKTDEGMESRTAATKMILMRGLEAMGVDTGLDTVEEAA